MMVNLKIAQNLTKKFILPLLIIFIVFFIAVIVFIVKTEQKKTALQVKTPERDSTYQSKKIEVHFSGQEPEIPSDLIFYSTAKDIVTEEEARQLALKLGLNVDPKKAAGGFREPLLVFNLQNKRLKVNTQTRRLNFDEIPKNYNPQALKTVNFEDKKDLAVNTLLSLNSISENTDTTNPLVYFGFFQNGEITEKESGIVQNIEKVIYVRFVFEDYINSYPILGFSPSLTGTSTTLLTENDTVISISAPFNVKPFIQIDENKTKPITTALKETEEGKGFIFRLDSLDNPVDYSQPNIHVKNLEPPSPIKMIDFTNISLAYVYPFVPGDPLIPNYVMVGETKLENGTRWKITILNPAIK